MSAHTVTATLPRLLLPLSCTGKQDATLCAHIHTHASRLIESLVGVAQQAGCYKVILDCAEHNVAFYAKCRLTRKEVQMVRDARAWRVRMTLLRCQHAHVCTLLSVLSVLLLLVAAAAAAQVKYLNR